MVPPFMRVLYVTPGKCRLQYDVAENSAVGKS